MQRIIYSMEKHGTILKTLGGTIKDFSGGSVLKSSPADAADSNSLPGLGRYPGEGHGNLLQCSWASLVAQLVKNLPAIRET